MNLEQLKNAYPLIDRAFELLECTNGADPLPADLELPETLVPYLPKAEKFLALLEEDSFKTFVCGDPDDADEIGRGVIGRDEALLVCESWSYGFDPEEAEEDRKVRNYGG